VRGYPCLEESATGAVGGLVVIADPATNERTNATASERAVGVVGQMLAATAFRPRHCRRVGGVSGTWTGSAPSTEMTSAIVIHRLLGHGLTRQAVASRPGNRWLAGSPVPSPDAGLARTMSGLLDALDYSTVDVLGVSLGRVLGYAAPIHPTGALPQGRWRPVRRRGAPPPRRDGAGIARQVHPGAISRPATSPSSARSSGDQPAVTQRATTDVPRTRWRTGRSSVRRRSSTQDGRAPPRSRRRRW
jgi:hypothetical protein